MNEINIILFSHEMIKRYVSAFVMLTIFVLITIYNHILLIPILVLICILMLAEWYNITRTNKLFLIAGLILIPTPIALLATLILNEPSSDLIWLFVVFLITTDSCAMIGGKIIKGPKLAPIISPNKTWSGLFSAIICNCIAAIICQTFFDLTLANLSFIECIIFAALFSIIGQLSDLLVSVVKRKFKIKDTGNLIPGHGGLLDRFDSVILTAPLIFYLFL